MAQRKLRGGGWWILLLSVASLGAAGAENSLLDAVKQGDAAALRTLVRQGTDVNAIDADGSTALHAAVRNNDMTAANVLLRAGAKVQIATRYGITPLTLAAMNGNAAMIGRLLQAGADPNTANPKGETVLMVAARTGSVDAIKALVSRGAAVNTKESWKGQTALMWAAFEGNTAAVETLINAGADIKARSTAGYTAFLYAVREGQVDVLRVLLSAGADLNDKGDQTGTLTALRSNGEMGQDGSSAMGLAVLNARYELAKWLLDQGADPNVADPRGSLLHTLAWMRRPGHHRRRDEGAYNPLQIGNVDTLELAKALLDKGANPNVRIEGKASEINGPSNMWIGRNYISFAGATPYYLAAKHQDVEYMRLLAAYGADPKTPSVQGVTPFMAAAGVGFWPGEGAGINAGATESEALESVKLAWELAKMGGDDVNAVIKPETIPPNSDGRLMLAHPSGGNTDGEWRWGGSSALHGAVLREAPIPIIQFLVEKGARLDAKNQLGWTPLTVAMGMYAGNTFATAADDTILLLRRLMRERGLDPEAVIICDKCDEFAKSIAQLEKKQSEKK